jgi:hypothetical protein
MNFEHFAKEIKVIESRNLNLMYMGFANKKPGTEVINFFNNN